ncbi:hypothetical protein BGZ52_011165 [Haplosporangium bisporale]|nr:hypothetical protein BGZ52_011165 [Haplosporangium bisporale]
MRFWSENSNLRGLPSWGHQLVKMSIVGSGVPKQELSHSSALWRYNMIYLFSPMKERLENIQMKETGDWGTVQSAVDNPSPEGIVMVNCNNVLRLPSDDDF